MHELECHACWCIAACVGTLPCVLEYPALAVAMLQPHILHLGCPGSQICDAICTLRSEQCDCQGASRGVTLNPYCQFKVGVRRRCYTPGNRIAHQRGEAQGIMGTRSAISLHSECPELGATPRRASLRMYDHTDLLETVTELNGTVTLSSCRDN